MLSKTCLFPGSFNPFHEGHKNIISQALQYGFEKIIIVIAQNPDKPINDFATNKKLIEQWINNNHLYQWITVDICKDMMVEYMQKNQIFTIIRGYRNHTDKCYEKHLLKMYRKDLKQVQCVLFKASRILKSISSSNQRN